MPSATGCLEMIQKVLPTQFGMYPTISADDALQVWSQGHSNLPLSPVVAKQRAVACFQSGAWFMVAPISTLGLRMDDDVIQVAAGLCLGLLLCRPYACASCKVEVDELGIHKLNSCFSKGCHSRQSP